MKKLRSLLSANLIRPTLYRSVTKCAVALTLLLLWDRYINKAMMQVVRDGCFVVAIIFLGLAWQTYLRMDGIDILHLTEEEKKRRAERRKRRRKRLTGDIVDYADEHIVPFDELDEEEQTLCTLLSNLLSGVVFLIPALISLIF